MVCHSALKTVPVSCVRCTQDSPCLVCQDWLPEAWTAQAKATAQRNRRKAAAAAKAAKKESEMMDDSVELHAPRDAFPTKRTISEDSSKAKRSKTATSSSQPKSVASSIMAVERPSSHGSDHRRSRMPERKRRHGEEKRHESPRHQSSRRDGHSSYRGESEHARPSSSGGGSSRRRAESGSVSKASDTRPSSSSSRHHQHHSSGHRRSLSSSSSRASPDRKSQPSHRERRRESSDRTGGTFVARRDVQLSPAKSKAPEKRTITVVASPARQIHIELAPAVPVPASVADGSAGAGPAASGGSATSDGPAARNGTATGNDPTTGDGLATGNGPSTGDGSATGNGPATGDGSTTGDGSATGDGPVTVDGPTTVVDTDNDNPADVSLVESSQSSRLRFDDPDDSDGPAPLPAAGVDGSAGQENPAATPVGGPDVSILTGTSTPPLFPSIPKTINQSTLVDVMDVASAPLGTA